MEEFYRVRGYKDLEDRFDERLDALEDLVYKIASYITSGYFSERETEIELRDYYNTKRNWLYIAISKHHESIRYKFLYGGRSKKQLERLENIHKLYFKHCRNMKI
jgi:hypothetical protein